MTLALLAGRLGYKLPRAETRSRVAITVTRVFPSLLHRNRHRHHRIVVCLWHRFIYTQFQNYIVLALSMHLLGSAEMSFCIICSVGLRVSVCIAC